MAEKLTATAAGTLVALEPAWGSLGTTRLAKCLYARKQIHPGSRFVRYFRTQVLLYESDVIRGNIVYSALDLTRMSIRSLRLGTAPKRMMPWATSRCHLFPRQRFPPQMTLGD